jgi:hypothetical protein
VQGPEELVLTGVGTSIERNVERQRLFMELGSIAFANVWLIDENRSRPASLLSQEIAGWKLRSTIEVLLKNCHAQFP